MKNIKPKDIKRNWHLLDAKGQVLGRLSAQISQKLMGKTKSIYTPYLDTGDYVVVINAKDVVLTGKKESQKKYYHHSGYPGGLYSKTAAKVREQKPEALLKHAIVGMLPKNKLGRTMVKKLYIYKDADPKHQDKFKN